MKPFLGVLHILVLLAASIGCGGDKPSGESGATTVETTLAVVPKSTGGEFWGTVESGARAAASDLGLAIHWEGTVTETEIAEQNKIIENMINLGVDGIALAPLNTKAQRKMVEQAVNAGIPVVIFDSNVDGDAHASFVATDNHRGGAVGASEMVRRLDGSGRVMVMRYVQGTGSTEARAAGFIEAATAGGLELVSDPYPDTGTIEGSKTAAANTLEGHIREGKLELEGIFACNLYSTLGVVSALDDLRKSGIDVDVRFVGFDTSKKLVEGVLDGSIDALVAQNPAKMGRLAVETLHRVVMGQAVEAQVDTGTMLVTSESLANDPVVRSICGLE